MSRRDEPEPTRDELIASFWDAHDRRLAQARARMAEMHKDGYRGFVDVHLFATPAPLSLRRSGKAQGSALLGTVFPVADREAPLPHGWTRYEIGEERIKAVAGGGLQ